jgi:hypothetical protein
VRDGSWERAREVWRPMNQGRNEGGEEEHVDAQPRGEEGHRDRT